MAYKVSSEEVSLFNSCYRQIAKIQVLGIEGLDEIRESDILEGGLTVDRYCFSSNSLEIGTAIASELTIELKNADGRFDDFRFDGARLIANIGIKKWDAKEWEKAVIHYIPLGVFTIDEKTKNKSNITLNALDNMVKFDREYDTNLAFPATLREIAEDACSKCGVLLRTTSFYNSDYVINSRPTDDNLTYRQVIQWIAQLSCTNAFIDWDGQLRFAWFEDSGHTIPPSDRYDSDLEEHSVLITGVKVVTTDGGEYTAGEKGSVLSIEGNSLVQSDAETIANIIYNKIGNFTYTPYSCVCRPMPFLYPMDMITFIDRKGNEHETIVSAVTYTMNGTTDVAGEGDGNTKGGYASTGSVTNHEKAIIEKAKQESDKVSSERFNVALALNQTIGSAFGLYSTEVQENGASTWYYHDKETLEDSTIIYVFNAGGFAWTDNWNDGDPIWQYGFTKDGNALYKILSTYKIQTEYLDAGCVTAEKLSVEYKQSVIGKITGAETRVSQSFQVADGELSSRIAAEKTRAEGVEETLSSSITQNAENISLLVSNGEVRGGVIVQAINAETAVKIAASRVDLTGYVTIEGLSGGTTTIDGACIKTGTLTADRLVSGAIGGFDINADRIAYGKTSYADTAHDGVWLSPAGISLGKGAFSVSSAGELHAEAGTFGRSGTGKAPWTIKNDSDFSALWSGLDSMRDGQAYTAGDGVYIGTDGATWRKNFNPAVASGDRFVSIRGGRISLWGYPDTGSASDTDIRTGLVVDTSSIRLYDYGGTLPDKPVSDAIKPVSTVAIDHDRDGTLLSGSWLATHGVALAANTTDLILEGHPAGLFGGNYSKLFDALTPVRWNLGSESLQGDSTKHGGFFADKIKEKMDLYNITDEEFGVLCYSGNGENKKPWGYRPDEILALCVYEVQQLKARVTALEA